MPWRLISFIVILAIFLAFITFNLNNKCDISFGVKVVQEVPVFLTVFASFVLGLLVSLPLVIRRKKKVNKNDPKNKEPQGSGLVFEKKSSIWEKKAKADAKRKAEDGGEYKEGGPYGID
jgi:uncharacterized integral membrane protein